MYNARGQPSDIDNSDICIKSTPRGHPIEVY